MAPAAPRPVPLVALAALFAALLAAACGGATSHTRFADPASRRANVRALIAILDAVFGERDWAEWRRVLESAGVAFGVVGTLDDIPHDAQMRDSGALVPIDAPRSGASLTVSSPVWMEGQEKVPPTMPPDIGEHSVEILREAGFDQAEIDRLLKHGVVVQAPR